MFGTLRRRKWITNENISGSIRKENDNNKGNAASVDQLNLDHPGLVTQFSWKLTSARIWYDQFMMYHFSDLTYVNLMRSTIQE